MGDPLKLVQELTTLSARPNYTQEVLKPLYEAQRVVEEQRKAEEARAVQEAAEQARIAAEEAERVRQAAMSYQLTQNGGSLVGSLGYSLPYGNCVNESGVNNPGWGNPISWPVLTQVPTIGASALFYFNHVAVVTGTWSNGDIEVRQQNSPGAPHRYPRSEFRGFR